MFFIFFEYIWQNHSSVRIKLCITVYIHGKPSHLLLLFCFWFLGWYLFFCYFLINFVISLLKKQIVHPARHEPLCNASIPTWTFFVSSRSFFTPKSMGTLFGLYSYFQIILKIDDKCKVPRQLTLSHFVEFHIGHSIYSKHYCLLLRSWNEILIMASKTRFDRKLTSTFSTEL